MEVTPDRIKQTMEKIKDDFQNFKSGCFDDQHLSIHDIVNKYGYSLFTHKYSTDDGYVNTCFRLSKKRSFHI